MTWDLRGKTPIVGAATAHLGEAPGWSHMEIAADAARAALADAGLTLKDVDGLFAVSMHSVFPALTYAEYLGVQPRFSEATIVGGSSAVIQMLQRPEGATIPQICEATGWQSHTVRGTFAGAFKKKLGLTITSTKDAGMEHVYRIGG